MKDRSVLLLPGDNAPSDLTSLLLAIYDRLLLHYGPQDWWPTRTGSRWEIMLGAVLTQHTNWGNVERALDNIAAVWGADGLEHPERLLDASDEELARLIAPAGFHQSKPQRLKTLARYVLDAGGPHQLFASSKSDAALRKELLILRGIGPETADAILLYALERPVFVADAYALRLSVRWGLFAPGARYAQIQALFMDNLPKDASLFNEYHALIVAHAKTICRARAWCDVCPLAACLSTGTGPDAQGWMCPKMHTGSCYMEEST